MGILIRHAVHADGAALPRAGVPAGRGTQRTEGQHPSTKDGGRAPSSNIRTSRFDKLAACRTLIVTVISLAVLGLYPTRLVAQQGFGNVELVGGYAHSSGENGLNGFYGGASYWFTHRIEVAAQYDSLWDTSTLGLFSLTSAGQISAHSRLQNVLIGPRVFWPGHFKIKKYTLSPYAEVQIGWSHLGQRVEQVNSITRTASGNSFSWLLGGGIDYGFDQHWSARVGLDFFRTHFANQGQSRWRLPLGVAYTFGKR